MKLKEKKIVSLIDCPVAEALNVIGGKWSLLLIFHLGDKKRRFGELKRLIPSISEKMLIQELKKLTLLGVLKRKAYKEIPPKVEYSLTKEGQKIIPIIEQLEIFGKALLDKKASR